MCGPEEWPSCGGDPADRIRLIGPAANLLLARSFAALRISAGGSDAAKAPQLTGPAANYCTRSFAALSSSLCSGRSGAFGGTEEYEDRETLNDVIETVVHARGNEDDRAGVHIEGFDLSIRLSPHFRPSARHVIHLILVVGGL